MGTSTVARTGGVHSTLLWFDVDVDEGIVAALVVARAIIHLVVLRPFVLFALGVGTREGDRSGIGRDGHPRDRDRLALVLALRLLLG